MALILPVIVVLCILAHGRGGAEHPDSVQPRGVADRPADGASACELGRRQFRDLSVPEHGVGKMRDREPDREE